MQQEALKAFSTRVTMANKSELIVIMYEIILTDIEEAILEARDNNWTLFDREVKHAQKFLVELMGSLRYEYDISTELLRLYLFVNQRLVTALVKRETKSLEEAERVLKILLAGFREISRQDSSVAVMQNAQQVYAGLTYGKGSLNETLIDVSDRSRGFTV